VSILSQRLDSDLGCWTHTEWRPGPQHPLAWAVDRVWDFDGTLSNPRERVFPNGMLELIVQLDDLHLDVLETGAALTPATCVVGIHSRAFVVESPRSRCRVIGVRLLPPGAWAALAHPLWELADLTIDLDDVLGAAAKELAERCQDACSGTERVRRVVPWLDRRLLRSPVREAAEPAVRWVADRIVRSRGRTAIGPLREKAGLSEARLSALFREQVGTTPKRYARIHRFSLALGMLQRSTVDLPRVALDAGYYDQPHMNAEFRHMAGLTPRQFRAARHYPDSPSLAEPV
jgi:AraC-like DNA-binding protein